MACRLNQESLHLILAMNFNLSQRWIWGGSSPQKLGQRPTNKPTNDMLYFIHTSFAGMQIKAKTSKENDTRNWISGQKG